MRFKAYAVATELDLNKMASRLDIPKKYTWEEPLVLQGRTLATVLGREVKDEEEIMVFAFGSIVFIDTGTEAEKEFFDYMRTLKAGLDISDYKLFNDDYELREDYTLTSPSDNALFITDKYALVPRIQPYHPELVSIVIAKSVALEKTEYQMEKILDTLEGMLDRLEKAKLRISDRELARTTAKIIRHEYNTISYIMILDKPDITWTNSDAAAFYDRMSDFFELSDRFEILKEKTNILNVTIGHFSSISHSLRGLFVEWLIVILILAEIILMVIELFR